MSVKRCEARVRDSGGYHPYPCANPAKYGDYCGQHSPEKRAERAAKRGPTKWERECAARKRYREALTSLREALAEFDEVTKNTPLAWRRS